MEVSITRSLSDTLAVIDVTIGRDEWIDYISHADFISADSPRTGKHPLTGLPIKIAPQPDIAWLEIDDIRIALCYNDGDVFAECDASPRVKEALSRIARDLGAKIVGPDQQILNW